MAREYALLAAFFPGAGRPELLTPTQRGMYLSQLHLVRYLQQQAMLDYHWFKVGKEGVEAILNPPPPSVESEQRGKAHAAFLAGWLGDDGSGIDRLTAQEFRDANRRGLVPEWALDLAPMDEIRQKAG